MKYLIILMLLAATTAQAENCSRFYELQFVNPFVVQEQKRAVPSYVKRFRQLLAHAPRKVKRVTTYRTERIKPRSTWGTYGWDKSIIAYRNKQQLELGKLFIVGVERENLGDRRQMELDIDFHTRFAKEQACTNKRAGRAISTSIGESEALR